jgi:DNA polymerase
VRAAEQLEDLRTHTIGDCHLCPLGDTRIKIVFGVGNPQADVMFVGEGPGFDEDRQGEPFVGKGGQLLDKIMKAIDLDRTKVYIANVVKCHPMVDAGQPDKRGNDRPPASEEIEKCRPFLMEQIRIVNPKIIVTLGGTATKAVLQTTKGITALRGQIFDVELIPGAPTVRVLPTFHPAALLRDESLKRAVWEDMKKLRDLLSLSAQ